MTMSVNLLSSSLGAQKQNKARWQQALAHHHLLCVHRTKQNKITTSANWLSSSLGAKKKKKKKQRQAPTCRHLFSMHKNKTKKTTTSAKAHHFL
jgi:hypothetical protein